MKRRLFFILLASLLVLSLAAGCAPQRRPAPDTTPAPRREQPRRVLLKGPETGCQMPTPGRTREGPIGWRTA